MLWQKFCMRQTRKPSQTGGLHTYGAHLLVRGCLMRLAYEILSPCCVIALTVKNDEVLDTL